MMRVPSRISAASFGLRHGQHLRVPAVERLDEAEHVLEPLARRPDAACGSRSASATQALSASTAGSISRSLRTAAIRMAISQTIGLGLEMLAPVALDRDAPDQVPGHQLADRVGDVRAREAERRGDLLGGQRPLREVEQRVDLADRAVDAPLPAHVAPMQDEALDGVGELCGFSVYFCHDRNIGN